MSRRYYRNVQTVLQKCPHATTEMYWQHHRRHYRNVLTAPQKCADGTTEIHRRYCRHVQTALEKCTDSTNVQAAPQKCTDSTNVQETSQKCTDSTTEMYRQHHRNVQTAVQKCTGGNTDMYRQQHRMYRRCYRNVQTAVQECTGGNQNKQTSKQQRPKNKAQINRLKGNKSNHCCRGLQHTLVLKRPFKANCCSCIPKTVSKRFFVWFLLPVYNVPSNVYEPP